MPRGVRKQINYEEEFRIIEERIARCKEEIAQLQGQKRLLKKQQETEELRALQQLIRESGKTTAQIKEYLTELAAS